MGTPGGKRRIVEENRGVLERTKTVKAEEKNAVQDSQAECGRASISFIWSCVNMTMPPIGAASAWRVEGNGGVLRLKHCKYDFYYLCRVNDIAACVAYNIRIILKQ